MSWLKEKRHRDDAVELVDFGVDFVLNSLMLEELKICLEKGDFEHLSELCNECMSKGAWKDVGSDHNEVFDVSLNCKLSEMKIQVDMYVAVTLHELDNRHLQTKEGPNTFRQSIGSGKVVAVSAKVLEKIQMIASDCGQNPDDTVMDILFPVGLMQDYYFQYM